MLSQAAAICPRARPPELWPAAQPFTRSARWSSCSQCKVLPRLLAFCPLCFSNNSCWIDPCSERLWWLLVLSIEGLQNGSFHNWGSWQTFPTCQSMGRVSQLLQIEGGVSCRLTYLPCHFEVWWNMMHNDTYSAFASRRLPLSQSVSLANLTSMQSAYSDVTTKMRAG